MTFYPSLANVLYIHGQLIEEFGGSHGLRDQGALEAALARPRTGYYSGIVQEAAVLWESLSQNHPFIDGNKRVAVTVTAAFLSVNGYELKFDDQEAYAFLLGLYESNRMRVENLEAWLRDHTVKR